MGIGRNTDCYYSSLPRVAVRAWAWAWGRSRIYGIWSSVVAPVAPRFAFSAYRGSSPVPLPARDPQSQKGGEWLSDAENPHPPITGEDWKDAWRSLLYLLRFREHLRKLPNEYLRLYIWFLSSCSSITRIVQTLSLAVVSIKHASSWTGHQISTIVLTFRLPLYSAFCPGPYPPIRGLSQQISRWP